MYMVNSWVLLIGQTGMKNVSEVNVNLFHGFALPLHGNRYRCIAMKQIYRSIIIIIKCFI